MIQHPSASWRKWPGLGLAALMLLGLFVLPAVAGAAAAYLSMLAALAGVILLDRAAWTEWRSTPLALLLVVAFALLAAAFALSADQPGDLAAIGDFLILPIAAIGYIVARRSSRPAAGLILASAAWLGAALAVASGSYEVYVLGIGRATGGFSSIYYSDIGATLGILALLGVLCHGSPWRWLLASGPLLSLACIQLGGTRGALIGFAVLSAAALVAVLARWPARWARVLLGLGVIVLLAVGAVALVDASRMLAVPGLITEALSGGGTADQSLNYRLEFYSAGLRALLDAPLYGHGWWQRFTAAIPYMSPEAAALYYGPPSHLHNDIVNFAAASGTLGLTAYALIVFGPILAAYRSLRDSQYGFRLAAVSAMCLGALAFGLSDSVFVFEVGKAFYVLGAVAILGFCRDEPLRSRGEVPGRKGEMSRP